MKDSCEIVLGEHGSSWVDASPQPAAVVRAGTASYDILLPDTLKALDAREATLAGQDSIVQAFTTGVLGPRWETLWAEAVSTALLGEWTTPLNTGRSLTPAALVVLQAEIRTIHRHLSPLWRHKVNGARVLLLDTPLGDDLTLYDLVAGGPDPPDTAADSVITDVRLVRILNTLQPLEREVALARAWSGCATWSEAALLIGAADPAAFGERVRRKLKRLGHRQKERTSTTGP